MRLAAALPSDENIRLLARRQRCSIALRRARMRQVHASRRRHSPTAMGRTLSSPRLRAISRAAEMMCALECVEGRLPNSPEAMRVTMTAIACRPSSYSLAALAYSYRQPDGPALEPHAHQYEYRYTGTAGVFPRRRRRSRGRSAPPLRSVAGGGLRGCLGVC